MSHQKALSQWEQQVSTHLGHLSRPQAHVLALWSYGMVLAKSCGITSVAAILAAGLGSSFGTLRQQLREWCYDAADKKGVHRQEVDVTLCFGPLLGWIVSKWPHGECRLALGMDATTLSDRFTVLCVSVLYRGCAIPVAWKVLRSGEKGPWEPYWKALFTCLQASVPKEWTVIVLADRGLYAPWLYRHLVSLGWHPFLRINLGGKVRPLGAERFDWLSSLVPKPGTAWSGVVDCFVERTVRCTLLACWQEGYADAWLVLTDLAPEAANVVWYCMRGWIEGGFKDTKRGGWQWHQTKMTDPARASRLWLAIAVATLWVVSVGGALPASHAELLCTRPATHLGGFARRALAAGQTLLSRALAPDSAPAQTTHQATFPQATSDHPASECPSFPFGGRLMLKNLPVKAPLRSLRHGKRPGCFCAALRS